MIILDNIYKINLLYKNYIKQYSNEYLKGNFIYIGDCLINNKGNLYKNIYIREFIKIYKNNFIKLLMNNCEIYSEIEQLQLCLICLENLNLFDIEDNICITCNITCHKKCIEDWYKNNKNNKNKCPICLKYKNEVIEIKNYQQYNNTNKLWRNIMICSILSIVIIIVYISVKN
jgi:hypothetical protein